MSFPFIIWTMRRTGGTTLAGLLETLSEHPNIVHEPFNPDRMYGYITDTWFADRDEARLEFNMRQALAARPVIKHCYELRAPAISASLMKVAIDLGYRHIVLDRRAEEDRILSLELAQATDVWGGPEAATIYAEIKAGTRHPRPVDIDSAMTHMEHCLTSRYTLRDLMQHSGQTPFVVYFEDVYSDVNAGRDLVRRLVEFVGLTPADYPAYDSLMENALLTRGQNSAQIAEFVPGALELRSRLQSRLRDRPLPFVPS